eukprot:TRINITY_DN8458_c0_g1_i1.p1 TRINITY_DN8458_c0_g1~~TRINITY_DN8458_c0_g1_i1.p1  ORF type:complete len:537 (+),score=103.24 TRINITY_DN8458_c0_g1_i1:107-1717(+)
MPFFSSSSREGVSKSHHSRKDSGADSSPFWANMGRIIKGGVPAHETSLLHRVSNSPATSRSDHTLRRANSDPASGSSKGPLPVIVDVRDAADSSQDLCPSGRSFARRFNRRFSLRLAGLCLLLTFCSGLMLQALYVVLSSRCIPSPHLADDIFGNSMERAPIVEYYVHGRGRGHASRGKTVVTALKRHGYRVCVFADSHVAPIVDGAGAETVVVPHMPVANSISGIIGTATTLLSRLLLDGNCDICGRRRSAPDVVITDGDFPGAWRASRAGVPAVAIGHGYLFSTTERPAFATPSAWETQERLNKRTTAMAKCTVGVSFVPLEPLGNSTIVARPTLRDRIAKIKPRPEPTHSAVVYFRDVNTGLNVHALLAETDLEVRAFGPRPTIAESAVPIRDFNEEDFIQSLAHAKMVVGTSGDNLIAECIALGIPMIALYDEGDTEQQLNAEMLQQSGYGIASSFQAFSRDTLEFFMSRLDQFDGNNLTLGWSAPDAVQATMECIQQVSPRAKRWHDSLAGVDNDHLDEVIAARRHLLGEA